jgi:hypothetical protein
LRHSAGTHFHVVDADVQAHVTLPAVVAMVGVKVIVTG